MGLPVAKLICASNANNVLTDFIRTGCYDRRREFFKTNSPSMDILVSSNLERYLFLISEGNFDLVRDLMDRLKAEGVYQIPEDMVEIMHDHFCAYCADDDRAVETIGRVWKEQGYLLDTHTAVAWNALEQFRAECDNGCAAIVLATASPYKFPKDVLKGITDEVPEDGFDAMDHLHALTKVPVPANLSGLRGKAHRFSECIDREAMTDYVKKAVSE